MPVLGPVRVRRFRMKRRVILTYFADYDELRNGVDAMHKVCIFFLSIFS